MRNCVARMVILLCRTVSPVSGSFHAVYKSKFVVRVIVIAEMSVCVFGRMDSLCPLKDVLQKVDVLLIYFVIKNTV